MIDPFSEREYGHEEDLGASIECEVTAVDLSGEPTVTVRPLKKTRIFNLDGVVENLDPLDIQAVPYVYPSSSRFAMFVPPEVGMQGFLVMTNTEVGEAADGVQETTRLKDRGSGFFIPSGNLSGKAFKGNAEWAELRSKTARIAISDDKVHLQTAGADIVIDGDKFDVIVGGVSLIEALQQMSDHIGQLEALVHPNGMGHGGLKQRTIDDLTAATVPARQETGVR